MIKEEYPGEEYEKRKAEEKKKVDDELKERLEDSKEHEQERRLIKTPGRRKKIEKDDPYKERFKFLDDNIEAICNMIYLQIPPRKIAEKMTLSRIGSTDYITPIVYEKWKSHTKHRDEIQFAYKVGAEESMHQAQEFMLEWLRKPGLEMQHVGLVREIGLFKQRMAGFMDRKRFGSKVEILDDRPQRKVIEGRDMLEFLAAIGKKAEKINDGSIGEEDENGENGEEKEGLEYTEFTEV